MNDERRRVLLGALLVFPGALDACAELLEPEAWRGDERAAVLGLVLARRRAQTPHERLLVLADWLRDRRIAALGTLAPPMRAFGAAQRMTLEDVVALARDVGTGGA